MNPLTPSSGSDDGLAAKRVYWGCTTFHCERGFHGTEEDMPREWTQCPACGSDLTEITEYQRREDADS